MVGFFSATNTAYWEYKLCHCWVATRSTMTPHPLKIHADVEMKCFQFDGVLHIKVLFASIHAVWFPTVCLIVSF